ncbi:MAG TPA: hemolysin family protein [Vicinamibacterales bacterium]|nr:hemolysin family protein [Vicinamibacterales bacterium]
MLTQILLVLVLILINGAFALSELAIVSSRRMRLLQLADGGSVGATRALSLAAEPTRFLSSVQVGITTIGILSGALGEATIAESLRVHLQEVPALAPYAQPLALAVVVLSITYVSLILGELVPKRLALANPERIASIIARPMQVAAAIGRPVVYLLSASTDTVVRLLGVPKRDRNPITLEEIRMLIEQGTAEGALEPGEQEMVTNILNLDERRIGGVLTPRSELVFLDVGDPLDRNLAKLREEPHAVLPLCDGGLQHVLGFVRATRILEQVLAGQAVDLRRLVEPAAFVPETATLMTLLEQFKRIRLWAALVVDEFGDVQGIVTLGDVMSSIVGDMPDDAGEDAMVVRREDGSWLLDGRLDLETVVRTLGDDSFLDESVRQHYNTLGGLTMLALERVPRTGDVFERGDFRFEVVDMDGNRVDRLLIHRIERGAAG